MIPIDKQVTNLATKTDILRQIRADNFEYCLVRDQEYLKSILWELLIKEIPHKVVNKGAGIRLVCAKNQDPY